MTSPQTPASSGSSLTSPSKGQEVEAVPAQGAVTSAAPLSVLLIDEDPERARQVEEGLIANAVAETTFRITNNHLHFMRGKLTGAGSRTGLYGNTANTSSTV